MGQTTSQLRDSEFRPEKIHKNSNKIQLTQHRLKRNLRTKLESMKKIETIKLPKITENPIPITQLISRIKNQNKDKGKERNPNEQHPIFLKPIPNDIVLDEPVGNNLNFYLFDKKAKWEESYLVQNQQMISKANASLNKEK